MEKLAQYKPYVYNEATWETDKTNLWLFNGNENINVGNPYVELAINNKYLEMYHLFEYDIFSDYKYLWNGQNPYIATEAKLGYNDITIRIATRINRKTDILKQFKEWYFEQFPDEKID